MLRLAITHLPFINSLGRLAILLVWDFLTCVCLLCSHMSMSISRKTI